MKITTDKLKDNQINLNWLKPSKLDQCLELGVVITLAVAWVGILASILFS
jgi:hypothetical protein